MVKAKDFLNFLCRDLNYRFFTGIPKGNFVKLRKKMTTDILNYVPPTNEEAAFGMAYGSRVGGNKSVIMIDNASLIKYFNAVYRFGVDHGISILVLTDAEIGASKTKSIVLTKSYKDKLTKFDLEIEEARLPGFAIVKEGFLS